MAWVAVDASGIESIYPSKPIRDEIANWWFDFDDKFFVVQIPSGSIEKLIGRKLTWADEPVELT